MLETTQCYLIQNDQWLMLLRNKKINDLNEGKWIGVGGKMEKGESPLDCIQREILEETGLIAEDLELRGIIDFYYDTKPSEKIYTYTCHNFTGTLHDCKEGTLQWISQKEILNRSLWEGDRIFLKKLLDENSKFFYLILRYDDTGNLLKVEEREMEHE